MITNSLTKANLMKLIESPKMYCMMIQKCKLGSVTVFRITR